MFFTDTYLNKVRRFILDTVTNVEYELNGSGVWQKGTINEGRIEDTKAIVYISIPSSDAADVVTGIRVKDADEDLVGTQTVSLARSDIESALYLLSIPLTEIK